LVVDGDMSRKRASIFGTQKQAPGLASEPAMPQEKTDVPSQTVEQIKMANVQQSLETLLGIDGAMAAAIVDANSGMVLGKAGAGVDLDVAGAGNTEVVRAKIKTMKALGLKDNIEDILITLGKQYHIIRPMGDKPGIFAYLVLDKQKSNLALARIKTAEVESHLSL
jgi:hypothetical protein